MPKPNPKRYSLRKRLSWRLEYLGYRFMEAILALVPLPMIDRTGSALGFLFYYLSPRYRRLALRNLRLAFGDEKESAEIQKLARATCQRTIANFLGTLKTTILPTEDIDRHVELEGHADLLSALSQGKGAILVLGHMGNWEVLNRLHQFLPAGTQAGGIYQRLKNPLVNAHLLARREQDGSRLFDKKKGFHAPASFVKDGGLLIVVADQKVNRAGIAVPFFGRLSSLSPLPALLARKAGAPVLAAGIETIAPGKWRIVMRPLGEQPQTEAIISTLENLIRRSPSDYLWLHNRWKLDGRTPLSLGCKKSKSTHPLGKPLRVLLISSGLPDLEGWQSYLAQRDPADLPLQGQFLTTSEDPVKIDDPEKPPVFHLPSPTPEQLAAEINRIDHAESFPLELSILLTPAATHETGLALTKIPRQLINQEGLPLEEFLLSKTSIPEN